jgi:FkbM family methyltransferase
MKKNPEHVLEALQRIAASEVLRERFIRKLVEFDQLTQLPGVDIRETLTGPIADYLYDESESCKKILQDGTCFEFIYRSKIARELVMSPQPVPDHVWEPQTTKLLCHLASGSEHALVGGAYFGDHAIMIAKRIQGECHAFEPNTDQRAMLERNARLNGLNNIRAFGLGLWDATDSALKLVGYDSFAHPEESYAQADDAFRTTTIDHHCADRGIKSLGLIMMDIEGAELRALRGAAGFLAESKELAPAIVFEVHRHYVDWSRGLENSEIVQLLIKNGYQVWALRDYNSNVDMRGEPVELIPCDKVYLEGPPHGFNMLALKDPQRLDGLAVRFCENVSPKLLAHRHPSLHQPCHDY